MNKLITHYAGTGYSRGFTLMEIMIILVIIGILASIAYPSYQSNMRQARRNDAVEAMLRIQIAQEKWRVSDVDYATMAELGNPSTIDNLYTIGLNDISATGYTISATANGDQANDSSQGTSCATLTLTVAAGGENKTPQNCWY